MHGMAIPWALPLGYRGDVAAGIIRHPGTQVHPSKPSVAEASLFSTGWYRPRPWVTVHAPDSCRRLSEW